MSVILNPINLINNKILLKQLLFLFLCNRRRKECRTILYQTYKNDFKLRRYIFVVQKRNQFI